MQEQRPRVKQSTSDAQLSETQGESQVSLTQSKDKRKRKSKSLTPKDGSLGTAVDPLYNGENTVKFNEVGTTPSPDIDEGDQDEEDEEERENWTGKLDFLLSCIGYAVGLGNIWRFPYLCYSSGGGAFLIPYGIFMVTCALPLFFLETSYGQFTSLSPITVWRLCPLFKGIGYGMVIITGIVCVYYNIIITWTFYYLFSSMQRTLPWSTCTNWWNTHRCTDHITYNSTVQAGYNVLQLSQGLEDFGSVRWPLFGCLALSWTCVFLCIFKGVQSSGKVVYITSTFPYLVLSILLGQCIMLPGAPEGVKWYLVPQWDKLASLKVWGDAATQIFFSVGMAWGSLITLASYNKFSNNVFRDAMIVPVINCFTSVFAGLVIFSVLGFMSHSTGLPIDKVVTQGPGLIFIVYPEAVAKMPVSHFWAILFFLMIFTIGLDSQFGMFETMTTAFMDEYPHLLRRNKILFTASMCMLEFLLGVPMVFEGGFYLLTLSDWYSSCFSLMLLSLIECLVISWIYGVDRFLVDIELMIGWRPSLIWKCMWKFITPAIIVFTWAFSLYQLKRVKLGDYHYPDWSIALGWSFALCSILPVPLYAVYAVSKEKHGTCLQRVRKLSQPAPSYGPSQTEDKIRYFRSFSDFDWLRHNAVRHDMDWRTYQREGLVVDKSMSNMADILRSPSPTSDDMGVSPEMTACRHEPISSEDVNLERKYRLFFHCDCTENVGARTQSGDVQASRGTRHWNVDETANRTGHARCYSI